MKMEKPRMEGEIGRYTRIRKVEVLEGTEKQLSSKMGLENDDLVLVTMTIEKVIGSPVDWIMKRVGIFLSER